MTEQKTFEAKIECQSCDGTGLYVGLAEQDGAAVVCHTCKGTGCYNHKFTYAKFTSRNVRKDVERVFGNSCGYIHSANDVKSKDGLIEFSKGGVSYTDWLKGNKPLPLKKLYCPMLWTGQQWSSPLYCKDDFFGGIISNCPYRLEHGMSKCWEEYEREN